MNRSLVASARKKLLRRGRALLRASGGSRSGTDGGALGGMSDGDLAELHEIHAALERIERGIYGRCDACQGPVQDEILAERPWVRSCSGCAGAEDGATGGDVSVASGDSPRVSA